MSVYYTYDSGGHGDNRITEIDYYANNALLAGCGKTYFLMKIVSAPCDKTGFFPLVLPRWGRLQRGGAGMRKAFFRTLLRDLVVQPYSQRESR